MERNYTMLKVYRELKAVMTPEEFRNEIIGNIVFLIGFPILFWGLWVITPA
jgi:hypothetical protein